MIWGTHTSFFLFLPSANIPNDHNTNHAWSFLAKADVNKSLNNQRHLWALDPMCDPETMTNDRAEVNFDEETGLA